MAQIWHGGLSRGWLSIVMATTLVVALHQAHHVAGEHPMAQFGGSVFLSGPWDWEIRDGTSRCTEMIDRITQYEINHVQFIPTFYWYDVGPINPPDDPTFDPTCGSYTLSSYYCYSRFNATEVQHWCYNRLNGNCPEVTSTEIDSFVESLGFCMRYAADQGLNLAVNARVDDGRSLGGWRNTLNFNPVQKYGTYSYEEAILYPLADALGSTMRPDTQVAFTLQGEMGATAFYHPTEWTEVIERVRRRIRQASAFPAPADSNTNQVLIGMGVNNNKLSGSINIGIVDAYEYLATLPTDFPTSDFDYEALRVMFTTADFLGISAYIPQPTPQFQLCELEGLLERMDMELTYFNLTVMELSGRYRREIHYTEYGIGGGTDGIGSVPACTAEEAAYYPFFGVTGGYSCDTDPFDMCHPEIPSGVRDYRRYFFNQSAQYFEQNGCNYHGVTVAYLWPLDSWDVLGIYPGSITPQGSFMDPVVIDIINQHNSFAATVPSLPDNTSSTATGPSTGRAAGAGVVESLAPAVEGGPDL